MQSSLLRIPLIVTLAALLGACATNRSEIKLSSVAAAKSEYSNALPAEAPSVAIRSVSDDRVFEEAPRRPSTPSLGFGGASSASDEIKARAIGRKRNGYGKALGDILLEPGKTVEGTVQSIVVDSFQKAGYRVIQPSEADSQTLMVEVAIQKFWAWLTPGFWALTMSANIDADVKYSGPKENQTLIQVLHEEKRQAATEKAWSEMIDAATLEFRKKVEAFVDSTK